MDRVGSFRLKSSSVFAIIHRCVRSNRHLDDLVVEQRKPENDHFAIDRFYENNPESSKGTTRNNSKIIQK